MVLPLLKSESSEIRRKYKIGLKKWTANNGYNISFAADLLKHTCLVLASGDPESNPSSTEFFLLCALVVWVESDLMRKNEELLEEGGNLKYDLKKRNIALKVLH